MQHKSAKISFLKILYSYFHQFEYQLLDLYYILRSFKKPVNDQNAQLNISYFGSSHSKRIHFILTELLNIYTTTFYKENSKDSTKYRCVNIDKNLNLNEILKDENILYENTNEDSDTDEDTEFLQELLKGIPKE